MMTLVPIKLPLRSFGNLISIYISFLIYVNISLRFLLRQPDCPPCTGCQELILRLSSRDRYATFPVPTLSAMSIHNSYTGSYKTKQVFTKKHPLSNTAGTNWQSSSLTSTTAQRNHRNTTKLSVDFFLLPAGNQFQYMHRFKSGCLFITLLLVCYKVIEDQPYIQKHLLLLGMKKLL